MSKSIIKIIVSIILVVLIFGTATGLIGYYSNWFTNWDKFNPSNWFNKDQSEQNKDNSGALLNLITNNGLSFVSDKIPQSKFLANGIAENADSAYELKATIEPSIAENKNVVWSARWNNIGSDWAKDKDIANYVTFDKVTTQSGENVIVTFLNDFGEQILITASAEADNTKKAICSVDYRKRIKSVSYAFKYDNADMESVSADNDGVYRLAFTGELKNYTIEPIPVYSAYTIDVSYSSVVTGGFTDTFGFGSGITLNNLTMAAGVNIPVLEPSLSSSATSYIDLVTNLTEKANSTEFSLALSNIDRKYFRLSASDKSHSQVINAKEAFDRGNSAYESASDKNAGMKLCIEKIKLHLMQYQAPDTTCTFMDNVQVPNLDTFLQNALACNNESKGVIEYFVKYSTGEFVYDFKLSLGFTSSSLQAVRNVLMDNGEIII